MSLKAFGALTMSIALPWLLHCAGPQEEGKEAAPAPQAAGAAPAAAGPLCNTSQPPNLGAVQQAITTTQGGQTQFISDDALLAQAGWCTFINLNWPAQGTSPTMTPNPAMKIGQGIGTTPAVWETWCDSSLVFKADGSAPPPGCSGGGPLSATESSRPMHRLRAVNPNTSEGERVGPHQLKALNLSTTAGQQTTPYQATGFTLPDKNWSQANPSYILYEVRQNPATVGYIVQNKLYSGDLQVAFWQKYSSQPLPPDSQGNPLGFPGTAFEVKPSWYVIPSGQTPPAGMFTAQACTQTDSQGRCTQTVNVGLTGFHLIWKAFPKSSWFWATFEYKGNASLTPILQAAQSYPTGTCPTNDQDSCTGPYIPGSPAPSTVSQGASAANAIYQPMLNGTVFANYNLVGVQVAFTDSNGNPTLLANNHIETDFGAQQVGATKLNPSSSCITCHYRASIGNCTVNPSNQKKNISRLGVAVPNTKPTQGYTGNGQPGWYSANGVNYVGTDFIWTLLEANRPTSCPP
jgi:hypothetical protein